MGPTTRAEFNRRQKAAAASTGRSEERKLDKRAPVYEFSNFDEILHKKKSEQLEVARSLFGG